MVAKQEHETDEEHERHKHEEEDMELCGPIWQKPHPELQEILKDCCRDENAVKHGVGQEEKEKLVVGITDTVVHPWTVMVHL